MRRTSEESGSSGLGGSSLAGPTIALVDVTSSISAGVEPTAGGSCEIVVYEMECLVVPLDPHDPRFHGAFDHE